jgi:hypothetical protein
MRQKLSPLAVQAFEDALSKIYWYKDDLKRFLIRGLGDSSLVNKANWNEPKKLIVRTIVDLLIDDQALYQETLLFLLTEVSNFQDFTHLEKLEDGRKKSSDAREAVANLREMMKSHEEVSLERLKFVERKLKHAETSKNHIAVQERLNHLSQRCADLAIRLTPQQRGFALEKLMYELFDLFDLDPKASFKIQGEQIDGAFSLEGSDYLFEAKWSALVSADEMDKFASKVQRKLDNTRGLMLSMDGYQPDGVAAHSRQRPVIILMTGADLMAIFEGRITFPDLLVRKRRHASQTGNILLQYHEM